MLRLLAGLALGPTAALTLGAAALGLGQAVLSAPSVLPFTLGLALSSAACLAGRWLGHDKTGSWKALDSALSRAYVFGHELTHALAAWCSGAKVMGFKAGEKSGHVDVSESNAFIALSPYCLPVYSLAALAGYRLWLWWRPESPAFWLFLLLMGATLSFHLIKTFECLCESTQPDLNAAGGAVFSLAWIALANGLVMLLLVKALFPCSVSLLESARWVAVHSASFWIAAWRFIEPLQRSFLVQVQR
ncbi:MAG: hypothetical protein HY549_13450 [Elusimicrobia bacterium]|nr:hypothetical protein [Elusimicrobiota bacterium]